MTCPYCDPDGAKAKAFKAFVVIENGVAWYPYVDMPFAMVKMAAEWRDEFCAACARAVGL